MGKILIASFCLTMAVFATGQSSKISESLKSSLSTEGKVNIFVEMREGTSEVLRQVERNLPLTAAHGQRTTAVYNALKSHADRSQKNVLAKLRSNPELEINSFWITNQVYIKNADEKTVGLLAEMEEVSEITEEQIVHIQKVTFGPVEQSLRNPRAEWGLVDMNVPLVWEMGGPAGGNGSGVIVGNIDTGVRYTHEAIREKWVGSAGYGWYDPELKTPLPYDNYNHGTLTIGAVVGDGGIGVAPGARWMACKGYRDDGTALSSSFIACGQFMACPTDTSGNNADCSKAPQVVSNSWGWYGGMTLFNPVLDAWIAAGILSSFSAGNEATCSSNLSPADQPNAIAIGAITPSHELASFSSKGPYLGQLKPEISGPGTGIYTADHSSDTAYVSASGTSLSCPLATGVLVLMKSAYPNLVHNQAKNALLQSASRDVIPSGNSCGGVKDDVFPNNHFGHGRIDAFAAMGLLASGKITHD